MAHVKKVAGLRQYGTDEMTGSRAILLAELAHQEGRLAEARGLVELAYRLFDEAADLRSPSTADYAGELYPA